jgi:hypothetical protein
MPAPIGAFIDKLLFLQRIREPIRSARRATDYTPRAHLGCLFFFFRYDLPASVMTALGTEPVGQDHFAAIGAGYEIGRGYPVVIGSPHVAF